jgi:fructokinase
VITVLGEAVVRLAQTSDETTVRALPGGSGLNIAIAAVRLGYPAALMARLSGDAFGQLLRRHAARNGVNLSAAPEADEPTTIAVLPDRADPGDRARLYLGGAASAPWSAADLAGIPPATSVLHIGSLAWCDGSSAGRVLKTAGRLRRRGTLVSTDLSVRPEVMGTPGRGRVLLDRAIRAADVVRVSTEDLAWLYPGRAPQAVAEQWLGLGPGLVVVTSGRAGAMAFRGPGSVLHRPAYPVNSGYDPAGDAFTAGLLGALHRLGPAAGTVGDVAAPDLAGVLDTACAAAGVVAGVVTGMAAGQPAEAGASAAAIHESLTGSGGLFLSR